MRKKPRKNLFSITPTIGWQLDEEVEYMDVMGQSYDLELIIAIMHFILSLTMLSLSIIAIFLWALAHSHSTKLGRYGRKRRSKVKKFFLEDVGGNNSKKNNYCYFHSHKVVYPYERYLVIKIIPRMNNSSINASRTNIHIFIFTQENTRFLCFSQTARGTS